MNSLDLYAKIESMIGFDKQYDFLYDVYIDLLVRLESKNILDVGCGNGNFLLKAKEVGLEAKGIDISSNMVKIASSKGINARCLALSEIDEKFDVIVCIADVLNYMSKTELKEFFALVEERLNDCGYFIFDINTKDGFELVADGSFIKDEKDIFLAIDASFDRDILTTDIVLFERENELFKKESGQILQYFHKVKEIKKELNLKFIEKMGISLFGGDIVDKEIFVFKK